MRKLKELQNEKIAELERELEAEREAHGEARVGLENMAFDFDVFIKLIKQCMPMGDEIRHRTAELQQGLKETRKQLKMKVRNE